ncbi:MAG TPA: O-acetyl-ADP-ribose deacetylase [Polyangiaceae bacterium]|jgi:O-acetyl-ADP-ribose deacetylase (regulator of RNase III)
MIEIALGNIVDEEVDAIVNAASSSLLGGGGVDGAIHRAAGPELLAACRKLGGCATGSAKITPGFRLKARHVIHAVGPVYRGRAADAEVLASTYRACLRLFDAHALASIAFPSISTGAFGYPLGEAAPIAVATVLEHVRASGRDVLVRFIAFDAATHAAYERALGKTSGSRA